MFFHYDKLNSVLDEDALYGKIGQILNQLDVEQINNEIMSMWLLNNPFDYNIQGQ